MRWWAPARRWASARTSGFTFALVRQIAQNAPLAVRDAKRAIQWMAVDGHRPPPKVIQQDFVRGFSSRDFQEGLAAYLARRPPKFIGR